MNTAVKLNVLPRSHSSATRCSMANAILLSIQSARGVLDITIGMVKKVQRKPFILQYDIDINISLICLSSFSINQQTVLLYELITKKG